MEFLDEGLDPEVANAIRASWSQPFIHLADTQILAHGTGFVDMEAPWRGRLSAVDGYWLLGVV
jgi:hypothetical protein